MSIDPFIGSRISIISNADVRYEGLLYKLNTEDATLVVKDCKCFGTEGRGSRNVPESARIHDFVEFRGQDIKDLSVLELVNDKANEQDLNVKDEFHDPAIFKTYNKEEMPLGYGASTNVHAKPRHDPLAAAFPTSSACSFGDPLLDMRPYGSGANIPKISATRMTNPLAASISPMYSGTATSSAASTRQANINTPTAPFGYRGPSFNDVFQHGQLKQVGVNSSSVAHDHAVLDAEEEIGLKSSFRHFGKHPPTPLHAPIVTGSHFGLASQTSQNNANYYYYKGNAPTSSAEAFDENADYFNDLLSALSGQRVNEIPTSANAGPGLASLVSSPLDPACTLNNKDLTCSTISANDIQKPYTSPLLQHQEDETASTTIPELTKKDSTDASRKYAPVYDKSKSFFDNLTDEKPERAPRNPSYARSDRRHKPKGKHDNLTSTNANLDSTITSATDADSRISTSPTKSSTTGTRLPRRRSNFHSRKWQQELDAVTFGEESLKQLPRHLVEGKRNNYQHRGRRAPAKVSGSGSASASASASSKKNETQGHV